MYFVGISVGCTARGVRAARRDGSKNEKKTEYHLPRRKHMFSSALIPTSGYYLCTQFSHCKSVVTSTIGA